MPALRKYFEARMSTASWLHEEGASMSFIWKTTEPSGLTILDSRRSHSRAS
jgi:ribosomal protein L34